METIFTYDPTQKELEEIDVTYPGITESEYRQDQGAVRITEAQLLNMKV